MVEAIHSTKMVDDKRLRIDISTVGVYLESEEVNTVRCCPGAVRMVKCMTESVFLVLSS